MGRFMLFLLVLTLASCDLFLSKDERTQRMVNNELLSINWNDVDQYPLLENCDETAIKEVQRDCFQQAMLQHFSNTFQDLEFVVDTEMNDTLFVDFIIDEHGFITVLEIQDNAAINQVIPNFKEEVSKRLNDLTTVAPALKRGIPVSVKFRLPIVLNTNN